jgi:hypothetical protein
MRNGLTAAIVQCAVKVQGPSQGAAASRRASRAPRHTRASPREGAARASVRAPPRCPPRHAAASRTRRRREVRACRVGKWRRHMSWCARAGDVAPARDAWAAQVAALRSRACVRLGRVAGPDTHRGRGQADDRALLSPKVGGPLVSTRFGCGLPNLESRATARKVHRPSAWGRAPDAKRHRCRGRGGRAAASPSAVSAPPRGGSHGAAGAASKSKS